MTTGFAYPGAMPGAMPFMGFGGWFMLPYGSMHCPVCGYSGPVWHTGVSPTLGWGGFAVAPGLIGGLGGLRRHGGTYSEQFLTTGLPTDEEIEEMVYDALDADPLIPWTADIEVESNAGVVTLRGEVPNKTVKHAAGDDAWWIPGVDDVRNELVVTGRRRARTAPREVAPAEAAPAPAPARPAARRAPTARAAAKPAARPRAAAAGGRAKGS